MTMALIWMTVNSDMLPGSRMHFLLAIVVVVVGSWHYHRQCCLASRGLFACLEPRVLGSIPFGGYLIFG